MMPSNFIFVQLSIIVLFMVTYSATTKIPQAIEPASQSHHTEHTDDSNQVVVKTDDDVDDDLSTSDSDEEYIPDYHRHNHHHQNEDNWSPVMNKHYTKKSLRTGNSADNRLWAIPYRFGKRAAMPYRFGKRAAMHFRLGKKSASL